jgi:hypothetical protein
LTLTSFSGWSNADCSTWVGSGLTPKYLTNLKKLVMVKLKKLERLFLTISKVSLMFMINVIAKWFTWAGSGLPYSQNLDFNG